MFRFSTSAAAMIAAFATAGVANAQWVAFTNSTTTRMPVGPGQNTAGTSTADPEEKDYAWGDINNDGWIDLIVVRKTPFTFAGGKSNVLFLNVNGVLLDRTQQYASTSINVPASELAYAASMNPPQSGVTAGFLDLTNDRDVVLADVNNDGWLDVITATTISDVNNSSQPYMLPQFLGHPRVYMNLGNNGQGQWQGLVYDYSRIPQMKSLNNVVTHPRFCSVAAGDVNGDGLVDLYFGDYDTSQIGPSEPAGSDFDNRLLINDGSGHFVDESAARMGASFNYGGSVGSRNLLYSTFGAASVIADMNGDGLKDVVKQTSLVAPQHVATLTNKISDPGNWESAGYRIQYSLASYFVSVGDLNNDGYLDMVHSDDNADRFQLFTGNTSGNPTYSNVIFGGSDPGFASNSVIADLDNDGWKDVIIADVDVDGFGCARVTQFMRNNGNGPNVTFTRSDPPSIPSNMRNGVHDVAAIDINRDGWLDLVIGRCSTTEVWMNNGKPSLAMSYPQGLPTVLTPNQPTNVQIQIDGLFGGAVAANTVRMSVSYDGGTFSDIMATSLGGNLYQVTIPGQACGASLRFAVLASTTLGASVRDPVNTSTAFSTYYQAQVGASPSLAMDETFEGGAGGWSVQNDGTLTSGAWEAASPVGTWWEGVRAAPNAAAGGSMCFVTGNGAKGGSTAANNVDGGPTHLISPAIDLQGSNARIDFSYWFFTSTHMPTPDVLTVSVSNNDGASWTTVGTLRAPKAADPNFTPAEANAWKQASFVVGNFVTPTSQVRVRFSASDVLPVGIVEAGIDNVMATKIGCVTPCPADTNGDTVVNVADLLSVIQSWGVCAGCAADINDDNVVNVADLLAVIQGWGNCPAGR